VVPHLTSVIPPYTYLSKTSGLYNMKSTEHLFMQYVLCTCSEQDPEFVMNLTIDGAMNIIQAAGVQVTEFQDDFDDDYD